VAEHRLNICKGCLPVRQKKRGQAPERNKAICEEVEKLVDADIMKEVHYHSWLSNPVMVKKHDGSWRMCVDFKDLNKACPKDGYPLPEIDWKGDKHEVKPKKCAFGMREGTFLGYKVDADGLRVCPDKVEAVLNLPSLKCLNNVQKLSVKLASINRFLSKSAEKSLPFFKTLKKCTKKSDFHWSAEAEMAFKLMKQLIAELPMLTAPRGKEELIMYLAAAKEAISAVLMTERGGKQMPIYFVSRALQGLEVDYTPMVKLILALHDIHYKLRTSVKGQIQADFIVERPEDDILDTPMEDTEELPDPWILFMDGSSCIDGSGAGLIIMNPKGMEFTYALRFRFNATNNEAEYEALIAGLRIAEQMRVRNLQANIDSRLVANQVNGIYVEKEPGMVKYLEKVKNLASTFKEFSVKQFRPPKQASTCRRTQGKINRRKGSTSGSRRRGAHLDDSSLRIANGRNPPRGKEEGKGLYAARQEACIPGQDPCGCQVHRPMPRNPQEKLTPITSPCPFYKWGIDIVGPFSEGPDKVKFLIVAMDYFTKWIEAKPVATITGAQVKKFVWDNIVCRFGLPEEIISDNGKQFRDNLFKDWCEKLNIRRLVEKANRSLCEGINAWLDERSKNWLEEVSHVLWAHHTMIKSSNGETLFSLTYRAEAVILVEIGMPTLRSAEVNIIKNNEALEINLDLLEEKKSRQQFKKQEARTRWRNTITQGSKHKLPSGRSSLPEQ
ncbi:reverse transcriptase domain-containing protein, partial [Tanacetum coccineum]